MARERYLINAGEDTIHTNEIKPETPKQKRENWWFYHKGPLIVILLAAVVVASIIWSVASQVEPDYTVALMTSYGMPEIGVEELERCIAAYADDRNGDGKVKVEVANYTFGTQGSLDQAERMQVDLARLTVDITTHDSVIFLHDEAAFDALKDDFGGFYQYNDGTQMPEDAGDYENAMRPWTDIKAFDQFVPEVPESDSFTSENLVTLYRRLRVSVRGTEGSLEKDKKALEYHQACMDLLHRLETGEPVESAPAD